MEKRRKRRKTPGRTRSRRLLGLVGLALIAIGIAMNRIGQEAMEAPMPTPVIYVMPEAADPGEEQDEAMIAAVLALDEEAGRRIEAEMEGSFLNGERETVVRYKELLLMSRIIAAESGPDWPEPMLVAIGEVVMNRVASPDWPDTVEEVLYQQGQYEPVLSQGWVQLRPTEKTVRVALEVLEGRRTMEDPDVAWQSLQEQGSRTVMTYHDETLGTTTYFCE